MVSTFPRFFLLALLVLPVAGCGGESIPAQAAAPGRAGARAPSPEVPEARPGTARQAGPGSRGSLAPVPDPGAPAAQGARGTRSDASRILSRGTLVGRIYVRSSTPRPEPLTLDNIAERHCAEFGGLPDLSARSLVTDAAGGLAEAVVWVEVPGDPPKPAVELSLEKRSNRFEPHLLVVRPGLPVQFRNSDPCTSTFRFSGALEFTLPLSSGAEHWQTFARSGEVRLSDPAHPWMEAWIVVRPGAHVATTGRDGSFELAGLPPGDHVLRVWHPTLGAGESPFTLESGKTLRLELPLPAE